MGRLDGYLHHSDLFCNPEDDVGSVIEVAIEASLSMMHQDRTRRVNPLVTYVGYEYDLMSGRVSRVRYGPEQKTPTTNSTPT